MESNIKEQLIKSIKNIKNKLKQMQEDEDNMKIKRQKILKPITDPLETLISLKRLPVKETSNNKNPSILNDNYDSCESELSFDNNKQDFKSVQDIKSPIKSESIEPKSMVIPQVVNPPKDQIKGTLNDENLLHHKSPNKLCCPHSRHIEDKALNVTYGVRTDNTGQLMIGNTSVKFSPFGENSLLTLNNKTYEMTPGLSQLLFEQKPDDNLIAEEDKLVYKDILIQTNAHKKGFTPSGQILGNSGVKYTNFIKPLFYELDKNIKKGGNINILKKYKTNTDFVYWDDPNEIIERLKILIASKDAGNTNHDNEIISIIEELKEAGIIK